ncbi:MAG: plastocyanin/azurin family copper-binding protein [Chloroflexota bacterium]
MRVGTTLAALLLILGLAATAFGATPPAETAAVLVQGFSFQPPAVSIAAGGSVTWTVGSDSEQHTVTPRGAGEFEGSGQLFTGDTFTVTFDESGTVEYFCSLHPNMTGTVEVSVPPTPVASAPPPIPPASPGAVAPPPAGGTGSSAQLLVVAAVVGLGLVAVVAWLARRRA